MAKKKNQDKDYSEFSQDMDAPILDEEPIDEEEESEEKDNEDVYAEDEGDKEMMRKLEEEDRRIALDYFTFDEEVGFNPMFDWTTVAEADRNHFVAWMKADNAEIENISWKRMNAFQKWMVARACSEHEMHEMFREIAISIIKVKKAPAELCIEDIYLELVWDYLATGEIDEAQNLIEQFEKNFPDEEAVTLRVKGLINIFNGKLDDGKKNIDDLIKLPFNRNIAGHEDDKSFRDSDKRDGVIQYEIGYALLNMKKYDQAMHYFDRAHNLANMNNDYELTMSVENARAFTIKCMNGDD